MQKRHLCRLSITFFLLLLMGLVGCSDDIEEMVYEENTAEPRIIENEFFLFKGTEDNENVDLLLQIPGQEIEKVVTNVDYFHYLRESKAYLFCEKIEELIYKLQFQDSAGNEHLVCSAAWPESIKITADETRLFFLREIDEEGVADLYTYELNGNQENEKVKVVSDISNFDLIPGGIVYVTAEDKLYIRKDGQESQLIATGVVPAISTAKERVFYKTRDNADNYPEISGTLYYYEYNQEPQKIDSNVLDYQVTDDGEMVFYLHHQGNLYGYSIKNDSQELVDTWLNTFLIEKQGRMIMYKDMDEIVYVKERGKKRVRVGYGRSAWSAGDGKIVYLAYNKNLSRYTYGKGQETLETGVKNFVLSPSGNSLTYYTLDDELFFQEFGKERIKIVDNITAYRKIYLGNSLLYEQSLPYRPKEQIITGEEVEECIPCKAFQEQEELERSGECDEHDEHDWHGECDECAKLVE